MDKVEEVLQELRRKYQEKIATVAGGSNEPQDEISIEPGSNNVDPALVVTPC